jgi:hypothetical protein
VPHSSETLYPQHLQASKSFAITVVVVARTGFKTLYHVNYLVAVARNKTSVTATIDSMPFLAKKHVVFRAGMAHVVDKAGVVTNFFNFFAVLVNKIQQPLVRNMRFYFHLSSPKRLNGFIKF